MGMTADNQPRLLRVEEVSEKVGLAKSTIFKLARVGKFPKQIKLTAQSSAWVESEINTWINKQIEQRNEASK